MNPVTIGLDLLLAFLLLAALAMGARLNSRLKALRDSHQSFAKAVGDLDAAASKADRALKGLHLASEEAHDSLLARIETARGLTLKLEAASEAADKAAQRAVEASRASLVHAAASPLTAGAAPRRSLSDLIAALPAHESRPAHELRPAHEPRPAHESRPGHEPRPSPEPRSASEARAGLESRPLADLRHDPRAATAPRERRPERAPPTPAPTPRRRPVADEDLFADAETGVRPGLSGLMRMSLERGR